ncbi:hypothetical protein [Flavobacterium orientale]|uniref:hypothetical protein n=1 Tax=Flavobacterium orientale TaxID=1756020 RepID=UPI001668B056|nr:hypothetical protein [Flavobacterium orientale]
MQDFFGIFGELCNKHNSRASGKNLVVPGNLQGNWTNALNNQNITLTGNLELTAHDYLILKK